MKPPNPVWRGVVVSHEASRSTSLMIVVVVVVVAVAPVVPKPLKPCAILEPLKEPVAEPSKTQLCRSAKCPPALGTTPSSRRQGHGLLVQESIPELSRRMSYRVWDVGRWKHLLCKGFIEYA